MSDGTLTPEQLLDKQNDVLSYALQQLNEKYSTDDQKNKFEQQKIDNLRYTFNSIFIIYYISLIGVLYFLYKSTSYSNYKKIFILIGFAIFPFIISTIELLVYDILIYIYSIVFSIPYNN